MFFQLYAVILNVDILWKFQSIKSYSKMGIGLNIMSLIYFRMILKLYCAGIDGGSQ